MDKIVMMDFHKLTHWDRNPRHDDPDGFKLDRLDSSLRAGYNAHEPMVVFPDGRVIQGNMRLDIMSNFDDETLDACLGPEHLVPCVIHYGDEDDAMLIALNDIGTGTNEKTDFDLRRAIVSLYQTMEGVKRSGMIDHLWVKAPDILCRISPAAAKCIKYQVDESGHKTGKRFVDPKELKEVAGGVFQNLEKLSRLPQPLIESYFAEIHDGVRRNKFWTNKRVNQYYNMVLAGNDVDAIVNHFSAAKSEFDQTPDTAPRETGPASRLAVKDVADLIRVAKSGHVKALLALFLPVPKAPEGVETPRRDALAEFRALDAALCN